MRFASSARRSSLRVSAVMPEDSLSSSVSTKEALRSAAIYRPYGLRRAASSSSPAAQNVRSASSNPSSTSCDQPNVSPSQQSATRQSFGQRP